MMADVYDVVLLDYSNPGAAMRLALCNKYFYTLITNHNILWKFFSKKKFNWKKKIENEDILKRIKTGKRCRECGTANAYKTVTTTQNYVYICCKCVTDENGYNRLLSKKEIFSKTGFKPKIKVLKGLIMAKKSLCGKHLFWKHEVDKILSYSTENIIYRKRILPF